MKYLAVFALLLVGCGMYDESEFSETNVCFEDGSEGRVSEVETSQNGDSDSPLGPADQYPAFDAKEARLPCVVTKYRDLSAGPGCIYYDCQNCTREDRLRNPNMIFCGQTLCLPYADGWVNPGYPIPFKAENVR